MAIRGMDDGLVSPIKVCHTALVAMVVLAACSDDRGLSQRQFTEVVRERVETEYQGVLISRVDETGFSYTRGNGDRGRIVTDEEYTYYLQHPEELEELVQRVVSLVGDQERLGEVSADATRLRRSILPVLKPPEFLGEAETRAGGQAVLYGEHTTGLLVFFVIDQPTSISFLTAGSLGGLGMSREQLTRLALDNLSHRTSEDRFVIERTADGPIAVGETLDGYDAARLISPVLLTTASQLLAPCGRPSPRGPAPSTTRAPSPSRRTSSSSSGTAFALSRTERPQSRERSMFHLSEPRTFHAPTVGTAGPRIPSKLLESWFSSPNGSILAHIEFGEVSHDAARQ